MKPCLLILFLSLCELSCGPGLLEGPEAYDTDTMYTAEPLNLPDKIEWKTEEFTPCPQSIDDQCPQHVQKVHAPKHFIATEWFDNPTELTHMTRDFVLAQQTIDGVKTPIALGIDFDHKFFDKKSAFQQLHHTYFLPPDVETQGTWVGIVNSLDRDRDDVQYKTVAAIHTSKGYQLLGTPSAAAQNNEPFIAIPNSLLQVPNTLDKLVYLQQKYHLKDESLQHICIYGEGIYCFTEDGWHEELGADQVSQIYHIAVSEVNNQPIPIASDSNGVIWHKKNHLWEATDIQIEEQSQLMLTSSLTSSNFTAAGNGALIIGNLQRSPIKCSIPVNISRIHSYAETAFILLLSDKGEIFSGVWNKSYPGELCNTGYTIADVIDTLLVKTDFWALTPKGLWVGREENPIMVE